MKTMIVLALGLILAVLGDAEATGGRDLHPRGMDYEVTRQEVTAGPGDRLLLRDVDPEDLTDPGHVATVGYVGAEVGALEAALADAARITTGTLGAGRLPQSLTFSDVSLRNLADPPSGVEGQTTLYADASGNMWIVNGISSTASVSLDGHAHSALAASDGNPAQSFYTDTSGNAFGVGTVSATTGFQSTGAGVPSSTAGNARGVGAVDLQVDRSAATQVAQGLRSVIAGGRRNTAVGSYDAVLSGDANYVNRSLIFGAPGDAPSVVAGGYNNKTNNYAAGIFSGKNHTNDGAASAILSGSGNTIANSSHAVIAGGLSNSVGLLAGGAFIGSGGQNSIVGADYASIIGGYRNSITAGNYSITGGEASSVAAQAAVALGLACRATGMASLALVREAAATGTNSAAIGRCAQAVHAGAVVIAANDAGTSGTSTTSSAPNEITLYAPGGARVTGATRWRYFDAVAAAGRAGATGMDQAAGPVAWWPDDRSAAADYIQCTSTGTAVFFSLPYESGTTVAKIRVRWLGGGTGDGVTVTLQRRQGGTASATWTTVGAAQTYTAGGSPAETVSTYTLPTPETMADGYAYRIAVDSVVVDAAVQLWEVGIETTDRRY